MSTTKIRDLLWLWGMKVNALQETSGYEKCPFAKSEITVEQVVQQTGITNVYIAGHLPLSKETTESIPSAKRFVCKTSAHRSENSKLIKDMDDVFVQLLNTKKLAETDRRIDAFSLDDFSSCSIKAGVTEDDIARMCYMNAKIFPFVSTHATIYPMNLDDAELPGILRYFDQLLLPIWYVDEIDRSNEYIDKLNLASGNKPILFGLYVYDFGNGKLLSRSGMQKQLDVVEGLLHSGRITGCIFIGTCLFDIGLEAVDCLYEWIKRVGDDKV